MSTTIANLEQLITDLKLQDFDLLLIGDGSGMIATTPCGWCVTEYDRKTGQVHGHLGGANGGTNNYAELMPYVHALWAYHTRHGGNSLVPVFARVLIVSDSEVTVRCGNKTYGRKANGALWSAIEWFENNGYEIRWHHVLRNSNAFSAFADRVAGATRKLIDEFRQLATEPQNACERLAGHAE